jgi:hypothetical protein
MALNCEEIMKKYGKCGESLMMITADINIAAQKLLPLHAHCDKELIRKIVMGVSLIGLWNHPIKLTQIIRGKILIQLSASTQKLNP